MSVSFCQRPVAGDVHEGHQRIRGGEVEAISEFALSWTQHSKRCSSHLPGPCLRRTRLELDAGPQGSKAPG